MVITEVYKSILLTIYKQGYNYVINENGRYIACRFLPEYRPHKALHWDIFELNYTNAKNVTDLDICRLKGNEVFDIGNELRCMYE